MFLKFNLYTIILSVLFIAMHISSQAAADATSLKKMRSSDYKAPKAVSAYTVLTKKNMADIFVGKQVVVANSGDYASYKSNLVYRITKRSDGLGIWRYTPPNDCNSSPIVDTHKLYLPAESVRKVSFDQKQCNDDNTKYKGKETLMCTVLKGSTYCKDDEKNFYELSMSGLSIEWAYPICWQAPLPLGGFGSACGRASWPRRIYAWDA